MEDHRQLFDAVVACQQLAALMAERADEDASVCAGNQRTTAEVAHALLQIASGIAPDSTNAADAHVLRDWSKSLSFLSTSIEGLSERMKHHQHAWLELSDKFALIIRDMQVAPSLPPASSR